MRADSASPATPTTFDKRRAWVAPHYAKMRAGDAELFANPDGSDEGFTES